MSADHPSPDFADNQLAPRAADAPPSNFVRDADSPGRIVSRCRHCGLDFEHLKCKHRDYCSTSCASTALQARITASGTRKRGRSKNGRMKNCEICGVEMYVRPFQERKGQGRFCGTDCKNVWQARKSTQMACEWCGKPMTVRPSRLDGQRFCGTECMAEGRRKNVLERTHNGKRVYQTPAGYIMVWEPDHPKSATYDWWYPEHRLVAEKTIGRVLESNEHVHHRDGDKSNNDPDNLMILSPGEHQRLTMAQNVIDRQREKEEVARDREELAALREELAALRARLDAGSEAIR